VKMVLVGRSRTEVLTSITILNEAHSDGMLCSIFPLEPNGMNLRCAAAPNLADVYRISIDGARIGLNDNLRFTSQKFRLTQVSRHVCNCWWSPFRMDEGNTLPGEEALSESCSVAEKVLLYDLRFIMSAEFFGQHKNPLSVSLAASPRLDVERTGTLREGVAVSPSRACS
jgi:hypothetical protein